MLLVLLSFQPLDEIVRGQKDSDLLGLNEWLVELLDLRGENCQIGGSNRSKI